MKPWILFLDDIRHPSDDQINFQRQLGHPLRTAASTERAKDLVKVLGMPTHMMLDHDLGGDDTVMRFLSWLAYEYALTSEISSIPTYSIHSDNPVGRQNIQSFMTSWRKSHGLV